MIKSRVLKGHVKKITSTILFIIMVVSMCLTSYAASNIDSDASYASEEKAHDTSTEGTITDETLSESELNNQDGLLSTASNSEGKLVIAIDPGHDIRHGGTNGYGLTEYEVVRQIAVRLKAILEQYEGVEVIVTRDITTTNNTCPYPSTTTSAKDIKQRVLSSVSQGADVYVSLHMNYSTSSSAHGAEIIIPNNNYNSLVHSQGQTLANNIINQLAAVGVAKRSTPVYSKSSDDGSTYPDGSTDDYFAVQNFCKLNGIPGIIIEHAFMSSATDKEFFTTSAGIEKLAQADAAGIVQTYNLQKKASAENALTVYRLYNRFLGEHLWSTDGEEIASLTSKWSWTNEGTSFVAYQNSEEGLTAVYRLYNAGLSQHLLTTDLDEIENLVTYHGWTKDFDGEPIYYVSMTDGEPVYRLYNPYLSEHLYTTNLNEYNSLTKYDWKQEGIAFRCYQN